MNDRSSDDQVDPDSPIFPRSSSPSLSLSTAPAYFHYHAEKVWLRVREYCMTLWIGQKLAVQYLIADTKRHKKGVAIGIFTVFLVVLLIVSVFAVARDLPLRNQPLLCLRRAHSCRPALVSVSSPVSWRTT
jgi:hypothetical protein